MRRMTFLILACSTLTFACGQVQPDGDDGEIVTDDDSSTGGNETGTGGSSDKSGGGTGGDLPDDEDGSGGTTGTGGSSDPRPGESGTGTLVIPAEVYEERALTPYLIPSTDDETRLVWEGDIALGWDGPTGDYSETFRLTLASLSVFATSCIFTWEEAVPIESFSSSGGIDIEQDGNEALVFSLAGTADDTLIIRGSLTPETLPESCDAEALGTFEYELTARVRVRQPSRAAFVFPENCERGPALLSGSEQGTGATLRLTDHWGDTLSLFNASAARPITVEVTGSDTTRLWIPYEGGGIGSLAAEGEDQTLQLSNAAGAGPLQLLNAESLDTMSAAWAFGHDGLKDNSKHPVENGAESEVWLSAEPHLEVAVWASAGEASLCHPLDADLVQVQSATAQTCSLRDNISLAIDSEGTCIARTEAPALNAGAGLSDEQSFSFVAL